MHPSNLTTSTEHVDATLYNFSQPHRFQYTDVVYELLPKDKLGNVAVTGAGDIDAEPLVTYMLATRYLSH